MKALYLLFVPSLLLGQEARAPQRGEERREVNRIERPEPVRVQPPHHEERSHPSVEPVRPVDPQQPPPPVLGGRPRSIGYVDPFFRPFPYDCWNRWDCRNTVSIEIARRNRRRPSHVSLTIKQEKALTQLRKEFIKKRNTILNNP